MEVHIIVYSWIYWCSFRVSFMSKYRNDFFSLVPCLSGSYYDKDRNECTFCRPGTYQPLNQQEECLPCPPGTSATEGKAYCFGEHRNTLLQT